MDQATARFLWLVRAGQGAAEEAQARPPRDAEVPRTHSTREPQSTKDKLAAIAGKEHQRRKSRARDRPQHKRSRARVEAGRKADRDGKSYERLIAGYFQRWYGGTVKRVPQSGGWAGAQEFDARGDLIFKPSAPYHVECKRRSGWRIRDLITGARSRGPKSIEAWWEQTTRSCDRGKHPLLVFTQPNHPDWLLTTEAMLGAHGTQGWWEFIPHFRVHNDNGVRVLLLLADFFAFIQPLDPAPNRATWQRGFNAKEEQ